jgi:hypothetical protein
MIVNQTVRKFRAFNVNPRFINMIIKPTPGPHPERDESTPRCFFNIYFNIIHLDLQSSVFVSGFSTKMS